MGIMKVKRIIFYLLVIGIVAVISGCVRYPDEPGPEPETDYQLKITVEVAGVINADDGIYYIVLDADENSATGPDDDIKFWEDDFYYVKLDGMGFSFAQVKDDLESPFGGGGISEKTFEATIAISDLGDPNSIDINVVTTDSNNNTYDSLDNGYFTINTNLGSKPPINDQENDSGEGGADFDIVKVTAVVTTLY